MKAYDFVENKGLKAVKLIVDCWIDYPETDVYLPDMMEYTFITIEPTENCPFVSLSDLKRLVESHALIESFNGLEMAKKFYDENIIECSDAWNLKQAIADVESCMEVKSEN